MPERAPTVELRLTAPPSTLKSIPPTTAAEVRSWFADRPRLLLPPNAVPILDRWVRELRSEAPFTAGWVPEGPGRDPVQAAPLIAYLREHAERGAPFSFNALWHEKQGGRRYPYVLPSYTGALTISRRQYSALRHLGPRLLLAAMRRDVRALLTIEEGWTLMEVDFRSCHAAIGVALSGDEQLAADVAGDIHQIVGDAVVPALDDPAQRRELGKALNNRMLFGATPRALRDLAAAWKLPVTDVAQYEPIWTWWWRRYPRLGAFAASVTAAVGQAQLSNAALDVVAPSGRVSRFTAAEVRGQVERGRTAPGIDGAWRSILSACFRAVEGDLLDETLRRFHADSAGGRPVLPLYDGLLLASPVGREDAATNAMLGAAQLAAHGLGLFAMQVAVKHPPLTRSADGGETTS